MWYYIETSNGSLGFYSDDIFNLKIEYDLFSKKYSYKNCSFFENIDSLKCAWDYMYVENTKNDLFLFIHLEDGCYGLSEYKIYKYIRDI